VDVFNALRLKQARDALEEQRGAFQAASDASNAEALRPTLQRALEELERLYDDEEIWEKAKSVVGSSTSEEFFQLRDSFPETLPPLLELFGWRVPPPPSADRLVRESVGLIQDVAVGRSSAEDIDEARAALGDLLRRTGALASADPWKLALRATETNDALEMGMLVVSGSIGGSIAGAAAGVAAGALTGGVGVIPGALIGLGIRRWRQVRTIRAQTDFLRTEQELLHINLFPAAAAALRYHLDAVVSPEEGPTSDLKTRAHLQALLDVSAGFALARENLIAKVRQAKLRKDSKPEQLFYLFLTAHALAVQAKASFDSGGRIDPVFATKLRELALSFKSVVP